MQAGDRVIKYLMLLTFPLNSTTHQLSLGPRIRKTSRIDGPVLAVQITFREERAFI